MIDKIKAYLAEVNDGRKYKSHLRLNEDGSGQIVNSNDAVLESFSDVAKRFGDSQFANHEEVWVQFACSAIAAGGPVRVACEKADELVEEYKKRFE